MKRFFISCYQLEGADLLQEKTYEALASKIEINVDSEINVTLEGYKSFETIEGCVSGY